MEPMEPMETPNMIPPVAQAVLAVRPWLHSVAAGRSNGANGAISRRARGSIPRPVAPFPGPWLHWMGLMETSRSRRLPAALGCTAGLWLHWLRICAPTHP